MNTTWKPEFSDELLTTDEDLTEITGEKFSVKRSPSLVEQAWEMNPDDESFIPNYEYNNNFVQRHNKFIRRLKKQKKFLFSEIRQWNI